VRASVCRDVGCVMWCVRVWQAVALTWLKASSFSKSQTCICVCMLWCGVLWCGAYACVHVVMWCVFWFGVWVCVCVCCDVACFYVVCVLHGPLTYRLQPRVRTHAFQGAGAKGLCNCHKQTLLGHRTNTMQHKSNSISSPARSCRLACLTFVVRVDIRACAPVSWVAQCTQCFEEPRHVTKWSHSCHSVLWRSKTCHQMVSLLSLLWRHCDAQQGVADHPGLPNGDMGKTHRPPRVAKFLLIIVC